MENRIRQLRTETPALERAKKWLSAHDIEPPSDPETPATTSEASPEPAPSAAA
ncbi:MAG TPA: hypothetical protein VLY23_15795 [Candidatus Acidoferrum sp.]|nr:hypothetical protein [Candidatus Acidoferrum sp.]